MISMIIFIIFSGILSAAIVSKGSTKLKKDSKYSHIPSYNYGLKFRDNYCPKHPNDPRCKKLENQLITSELQNLFEQMMSNYYNPKVRDFSMRAEKSKNIRREISKISSGNTIKPLKKSDFTSVKLSDSNSVSENKLNSFNVLNDSISITNHGFKVLMDEKYSEKDLSSIGMSRLEMSAQDTFSRFLSPKRGFNNLFNIGEDGEKLLVSFSFGAFITMAIFVLINLCKMILNFSHQDDDDLNFEEQERKSAIVLSINVNSEKN